MTSSLLTGNTASELTQLISMPTRVYFPDEGGIAIKVFEPCDNGAVYAITLINSNDPYPSRHRLRVYTEKGGHAYVRYNSHRYRFEYSNTAIEKRNKRVLTNLRLCYLGLSRNSEGYILYWFLHDNEIVCHSLVTALDLVRSVKNDERDCKIAFDQIRLKQGCNRVPIPEGVPALVV